MHDSIDVSTGLVIDPREGYLTMNGVPNSLQFYDLHNDRFISELEVAAPNAVRRDIKCGILPVSRVEHSAFTHDGTWLITVDHRVSEWDTDECSLKFWLYNTTAQKYQLHSRVDSPHSGPITSLACHPTRPLVVTTSTDTKFKVWSLSGTSATDGYFWRCRSVGYYRGQRCSSAAFSPDGSVLAIGSGAVVSFWDPIANTLLFALTHSISSDDEVKKVVFLPGTPLVVTTTNSRIVVWNLVTRSQWWSYAAAPSLVACDSKSALFAIAFRAISDNYIAVFDGYDPKPQSLLKLASKALALAFVPEKSQTSNGPLIAYVNEHNEIVVLEKEKIAEEKGNDVRDDVMGKDKGEEEGSAEVEEEFSFFHSSFVPIVQKKRTESDEPVDVTSRAASIPGVFGDIFDGPTHALPPLEKLLPIMFERLLIKNESSEKEGGSEKVNDDVVMNGYDDVSGGNGSEKKKDGDDDVDIDENEKKKDDDENDSMKVEEKEEEDENEDDSLPDGWLKYEVENDFFVLNKKAYDNVIKK